MSETATFPAAPIDTAHNAASPLRRLAGRIRDRPWRAAGIAAVLALLAFAWLSWALPISQALQPLPEPTLILLDRSGESFARRGAYKETPVDVRILPRHVRDAVLAIEDRRFYSHAGIDLRGVARAARHNATAGKVEQGGSTITQQLAKTSFLSSERTFRRKAQEALIATWLELRLDKNEILSRYLSSVYFGDGTYGLRAAARHYFDTTPEKLDLGQAAMLAGMIKAPSTLAPTDNLRGARARAQVVLRAMVEAGAITQEQADRARPARLRSGRADLPVGSYFADWVSPQAKNAFAADYGEVHVPTTLDPRLQALAEQVVRDGLRRGARDGVGQAALVAMRSNGEVLAMVGGGDYAKSAFNRVTQAQRQPGSTFKLFVYLAALRDGMTADSLVDDAPITLGDWTPQNYANRYAGPVALRDAFAQSSNVAAVRLTEQVGPRAVVRAARDLGIRSELANESTIALGVSETNLLEMTAAYASLGSQTGVVQPRGLMDIGDDDQPRESAAPALEPAERAALLDLLWSAVDHGTGKAARLSVPVFGKTGTTQENRDAMFIGLAGDIAVGVWLGNDDNTPMRGVTGGGLPAQMWSAFTAQAIGARALGAPPVATTRRHEPPRSSRWQKLRHRWFGKGKKRGRH
ncbi:transglycosylase domain-containing protein [Lysobacter koreensis]|uniref:peptidoglycan glycosyltransferase n=1 Tax=Lysobacter koreensis TaxID=266122 RepID=A0ABW2YUJ9_9GAMM